MATENQEFILDPNDDEAPIQKTKTQPPIMTEKAAPTEQKAGKGKKFCPQCNELQGARASSCSKCGHVFTGKAKSTTGEPRVASPRKPRVYSSPSTIDESAFIKVLAGKGFKFSRLRDEITGEIVKDEKDPKIKALNLKYQEIELTAEDGIYVTQTSPQIQITMTLEAFLDFGKLKA